MGMQDRQASLTLLAKVDEATVLRSIKRLRDLQAAEKDVTAAQKQMGDADKRATSDLLPLSAAQQKYIANIKLRSDAALKEMQLSRDLSRILKGETDAREAAAKAAGDQAGASSKKQLTALAGSASALGGLESLAGAGPGGDILRAISSVARLKQQIDAFSAASETAGATAGEVTGGISALGGGLASLAAGGVAAAAIAVMSIAIQKFVEDINRQQQALTNVVDAQQKYHELVLGGTAEEIQAGLKDLEIKRQATAATLADAEAGLKATESMDGFSRTIADLLKVLGVTTKDVDRKREELSTIDAELDAYKRAARDRNISTTALEQSTNALKAATQTEQKRNAALDEAKRKEEERAKAIQQATQEIAQATQREAQAEAEANQKRIEKMADIAAQFARSSADALRKLQQDQSTMAEKFGQEQADTVLAAQRDEEQAAREHVRNIADIRKKAQRDEFEASLSLDFARIAAIRRGAADEVDQASERFAAERQQANLDLKYKLQDAAIAFQRERAARLQDYKNQLIDLRIAKARQQEDARIAYQRDIVNLRQRLQDEINLKNSALQATLAATRTWANAMRAAVGSGGTVARRAYGGPLSAFQTSLVNEMRGQRESFTSGGASIMLPAGMGVFTPFRGGSVSNSSSVGPVSIVINESRNPRETQAMIDKAIKRLVQ